MVWLPHSLEEVKEGAGCAPDGVSDLLLGIGEEFGLGGERLPLRFQLQIVVHELMAEEHVLVTPVTRDHPGLGLQLTNFLLSAAKLNRLVSCVNVEQD